VPGNMAVIGGFWWRSGYHPIFCFLQLGSLALPPLLLLSSDLPSPIMRPPISHSLAQRSSQQTLPWILSSLPPAVTDFCGMKWIRGRATWHGESGVAPFPRTRCHCPKRRPDLVDLVDPLFTAIYLALIAGNSSVWLPFWGWTRLACLAWLAWLGGTYMIQIST
jgi:hypothetical protein